MTLYELTEQLANFDFEIDEETGEITNMDELEQIQMDRDEKLKNCVLWYKNCKAEADALKAEKMNLQKRQQIAEKKAERMKSYLDFCLKGEQFTPKDDVRVRVSYRKSDQVLCDDITKVSDEYLRYKEPELDKTKVKKDIKAGIDVDGCKLITKKNIQIK